jgi:hypothetical protein
MAKLLKINGLQVFTWSSKTIFTAMRTWCWIIILAVFASSCLETAECIKNGDTALVISFKKLSDGLADTVILYNISAVGSDSVFYKYLEPDKLDTLEGSALLAVNPYAEETLFTFLYEARQVTLKVGYKNEVQFISEECGSDRVQTDLTILETQFDSVRVVNNVLTRNRTTNIEIFN